MSKIWLAASARMKSNTTMLSPMRIEQLRPLQLEPEVVRDGRPHSRLDLLQGRIVVHILHPGAGLVGDEHAEIRREDDDRFREVHRLAAAAGEPAAVQNLEKRVQDPGVRLLDLVEEQDAEGPLPDRVHELRAGVVADVARRRAHQARHGVLGRELAHVEPAVRLVVAEDELGQRLGPGSVLPTPVGPAKNSTPRGRVPVPDVCAPVRFMTERTRMPRLFLTAVCWPLSRLPMISSPPRQLVAEVVLLPRVVRQADLEQPDRVGDLRQGQILFPGERVDREHAAQGDPLRHVGELPHQFLPLPFRQLAVVRETGGQAARHGGPRFPIRQGGRQRPQTLVAGDEPVRQVPHVVRDPDDRD